MSHRTGQRSLGDLLQTLREEKIDCILIGMMAAIHQGAPLMTLDYDFWLRLPVRQYIRVLRIVRRLGGTIRANTVYELADGTQVNAIFRTPDGLQSFDAEWRRCRVARFQGQPVRVLPLRRVIASKRASDREKDRLVLPVLRRTLRMARRLTAENR